MCTSPQEYIENIQKLRNEIQKNNPETKFIFIAPWISTDGDKISKLKYKDKIQLNNKYTKELKKLAQNNLDILSMLMNI